MIRELIDERLRSILAEEGFNYNYNIEIPDEKFGDYSTNVALIGAKYFKKPPREVAKLFQEKLQSDPLFSEVSIAGPGFINFRISKSVYVSILGKMIKKKENYWKLPQKSIKIQLEYGSANPTGPFTVGHGRQLVIGDVLGNVLRFLGYEVDKEMYLNDAGRQIRLLAKSLWVRYNELFGKKYDLPEDGYKGSYLIDIAKKLVKEIEDKYVDVWNENVEKFFMQQAVANILSDMEQTLSMIDCKFNNKIRESFVIQLGYVDKVLKILKEKDLVYEKDQALWFKVSEFIGENDKVLIRRDGTYTYFLTDIAYHLYKFERKYDKVYDIFGSDHHGHIPRMKAAMSALDIDEEFLNFILHQFVTLKKSNEIVKMSTRAGNFITLEELVKEVGKDPTRYFFVMNDINTHLVFDLDLAKSKSNENPVYYVQYAYARIKSIFEKAGEKGIKGDFLENIDLLENDEEMGIIKLLDEFVNSLKQVEEKLSPHFLTNYIYALSEKFHSYYAKYKIVDEENISVSLARLGLLSVVKEIYKIVFKLLGIEAPERM
ncbi:arginyl-tRNA synthetase [Thermosipho melanesiensis]|uniref:Arginine--tRNA ligase n=2 Tax=Thermosipho melanesiensis TaxID=46541 RepID=A6LN39_THEM4|nr:arginine--tRNA ligase [Thermosipho melanesiensis]ABR31340.1 arginyl-tRNA synthetase [Thermosipho melanesiensis BI429]APT74400.1 arginyl-tRNA synthetase [Thermosipho melanesiensis]OOC36363.1 arginyl-tRNA synthetase [Thermosipho melanesiensis]OOC37181.1 arginyl-tRNA synthetase [Thermosipho melanesiensis]OOC37933.1 arginyl-tRNA synthetase [Thermosipho melanesiensis]